MDENTSESHEYAKGGYGKRPLWQWILIYLVIGGAVYMAIYYFYFAKKGGMSYNYGAAPTPATSSSGGVVESATVMLTARGFEPMILTINAGTTVAWTNKSDTTGNVSSDDHPTHQKYPPLNLGDFPSGATVSLQFNEPGPYTYHDHLNPSTTGSIIVQ